MLIWYLRLHLPAPVLPPALRFEEHRRIRGRIMGSLAVSLLTFVGCGVLVLVEQASAGLLFFLTLGLIVTSGLATAVLQV